MLYISFDRSESWHPGGLSPCRRLLTKGFRVVDGDLGCFQSAKVLVFGAVNQGDFAAAFVAPATSLFRNFVAVWPGVPTVERQRDALVVKHRHEGVLSRFGGQIDLCHFSVRGSVSPGLLPEKEAFPPLVAVVPFVLEGVRSRRRRRRGRPRLLPRQLATVRRMPPVIEFLVAPGAWLRNDGSFTAARVAFVSCVTVDDSVAVVEVPVLQHGQFYVITAPGVSSREPVLSVQADHAWPVPVPRQPPINALVFVEEVLVQVSVQNRIGASVGGPQQLQNPVNDLLLGRSVRFEERRPEFRSQSHQVDRQPAEEKYASHGDDDVVRSPASNVGVLVLRRRSSPQTINHRKVDIDLKKT